jgi:hypothetical protein
MDLHHPDFHGIVDTQERLQPAVERQPSAPRLPVFLAALPEDENLALALYAWN